MARRGRLDDGRQGLVERESVLSRSISKLASSLVCRSSPTDVSGTRLSLDYIHVPKVLRQVIPHRALSGDGESWSISQQGCLRLTGPRRQLAGGSGAVRLFNLTSNDDDLRSPSFGFDQGPPQSPPPFSSSTCRYIPVIMGLNWRPGVTPPTRPSVPRARAFRPSPRASQLVARFHAETARQPSPSPRAESTAPGALTSATPVFPGQARQGGKPANA